MPPPAGGPTFSYVLIPWDDSEPLQQLSLRNPTDLQESLGCLTTELQGHFRKYGGSVGDEGKEALKKSLQEQMEKQGSSKGTEVDPKMLAQMASSQTVDIVQLLPATEASKWYGVTMYVDDKGVAKGAPVNRRASDICAQCGMPTEVRGDAFVARAWDDQDGFQRLDFSISELASDAAWMVEARSKNANRMNLEQAAAKLNLSGPAKPAEPELPYDERLDKASELRAEGTTAFKASDVGAAATKYEAALALFTPSPPPPQGEDAAAMLKQATELRLACLLNLAACRLKQQRYYDVISACDLAIEIDDGSAKAWFRRGQACMALQQFGAARKNLTRAATLLPSSREIRDEIERCKQLAEERAAL
uniref:Uncharacterized protein n=1 Tax=Chrysotila carterae TaxID=13221 RepID=A0A7S4C1E6_CHRCT